MGFVQYRSGAEYHLNKPEMAKALHAAVKAPRPWLRPFLHLQGAAGEPTGHGPAGPAGVQVGIPPRFPSIRWKVLKASAPASAQVE